MQNMDRCRRRKRPKIGTSTSEQSQEVASSEWQVINMTEQEEDLVYRMYRLVGPRWDLIAGRVPGRKAEELERFWIMRHSDTFADVRNQHTTDDCKINADSRMLNGLE